MRGEAERRRERRAIERGQQDFTVLLQSAASTPAHFLSPHSSSHTLLHPVLGYGPRPALVFYLYPVAQHPGEVHDFVSRKTGCVYWEMRKTLLGELNHRNSYLPSLPLTTMQNHAHRLTQRPLPRVHVHMLSAYCINLD